MGGGSHMSHSYGSSLVTEPEMSPGAHVSKIHETMVPCATSVCCNLVRPLSTLGHEAQESNTTVAPLP